MKSNFGGRFNDTKETFDNHPAGLEEQFDLRLTPKSSEFAVAGWANLEGRGAEG